MENDEQKKKERRIEKPVILIDGHCYLCQDIVRYLVKRDSRARFRFAALQSPAGRSILKAMNDGGDGDMDDFDSFILAVNGRYYNRSGAALRVWKGLGGWRSLAYALIVIPAPIRDAVYRFIARNRYRWFGKSEQCLLPTKEVRERFLPEGF